MYTPQDPAKSSSTHPVRLAIGFYLPMFLCAVFLRSPGTLQVTDWTRLAWGIAAATAVSVGVVMLSRISARGTSWGRALQGEFHRVLGPLGSREILWLSLLSAAGEEILFRGVLVPRAGVWWGALLFAGFHFPYRRTLLPWTAFALLMGLALGWLTVLSNTLWPAMLTHFCINYFNLHDIAQLPDAPAPSDGAPGRNARGDDRNRPN